MQKDPFEEEYGRHSNFRPSRGSGSSSVLKWLLVVFLVAFGVLGYERMRKGGGKPPAPAVAQQPLEDLDTPPSAEAEAPPAPDSLQTYAAPVLPGAMPAPVRQAEAVPHAEPEKRPTVAKFEMSMNQSNSFIGQGYINGRSVRLLADTGATTVVVPQGLAQQFGLKLGARIPFKTGGGVVYHYATVIDKLTLGRIEIRNVEAAINPAMGDDFVLLGMSALSLMDMELQDGKLVLQYKQPDAADGGLGNVEQESFKRPVKDCVSKGNKIDKQTLDCLRGL
ncbi:MAG: TIGR02281 family clan AA aspartic protease [Candidatus Methylumidiphilus sp.]